MDKSMHRLEQHFSLPQVRRVDALRPLQWLKLGWHDLLKSPVSLAYGLVYAAAGWAILLFAADRPYLFTAAISGFFLIAPLLAAGLYELSRRHMNHEPATFASSFAGWTRNGESMAYMGLVLAIAGIAWERLSAILFALFYGGNIADLSHFVGEVLLSGQHMQFLIAYLVVGGALAALVFALCAVSLPMIMDREIDIATAMMTSLNVVAQNPGAMAVWALLLVSLTLLGFASWLVGLVVILPILGHATWHAYKETVV